MYNIADPMSEKTIHLLFDASPLAHNKTGVGHFTERLLVALANQPNVKITAYYFNFLGLKKTIDLPSGGSISYKEIRLFPSKILSVFRRVGLQLPVELFAGWKQYDFAIFPNFVALPSLKRTPYAVAIHDMCFLDHPEYMQPLNTSFLQRFTKQSAVKSDLVITISEFTKSRIENHFGKKVSAKALILPIPYTQPKSSGAVRASIKMISKKPFALYVGTIEPRKNILGLVDGFSRTPSALLKSSGLVLAGGIGWKTQETLDLIHRCQSTVDIHQLGYVTNAERDYLYQKASVVCLFSHYEGFGMPILEAMHYKKPLLLSSIPVFKEVAGTNATYCDPNNPEDVAKKLEPFLSHKPNSLVSYPDVPYDWHGNASKLLEQVRLLQKKGNT